MKRTLLALTLLTSLSSASVHAQLLESGVAVDLPAPAAPPDRYGVAVAVDGDFTFVGAPGSTTQAGSVFVFDAGVLVQTLRSGAGADARFGTSLAVQPGRLIVGAPGDGAAYLYSRISGEYQYVDRLTPSEPSQGFGERVALFGFAAYVGAPIADIGGVDSNGAVHRFTSSALGNWTEQERIDGPLVAGAQFGMGLAYASGRLFVGARLASLPGGEPNGLVYVYTGDGTLLQTIEPEPGALGPSRGFGREIVADGDWMMAHVTVDDEVGQNRAVVIYEFDGAAWVETHRLSAPEHATLFAAGLSLSGSNLLVRDFDADAVISSIRPYHYNGSEWRPAGVVEVERSFTAMAMDGLEVAIGGPSPNFAARYSFTLLPDTDDDGIADADDEDDDNDGVLDAADGEPLDPTLCRDMDEDGCDDCSIGDDGFGPMPDSSTAMDGADDDADGVCDLSDICTGDDALGDPDGDGVCGGVADAGVDGGTVSDAGPSLDGGARFDAGPATSDAGPPGRDSGTASPDGSTADAGAALPSESSGCGCIVGAGDASPTWFALLALCALVRRRRRA